MTAAATPAANRERLKGMAAVASSFRAFRPAHEVVLNVEAVPTQFPDFDRVVGVGGLPTSRVVVVHGPSNNGKTSLSLGLGMSSFATAGWLLSEVFPSAALWPAMYSVHGMKFQNRTLPGGR